MSAAGVRAAGRAGVAIAATAGASRIWGVDALGVNPAALPKGARWGAAFSVLPLAALIIAWAPHLRRRVVGARVREPHAAEWLLLRIPLGTVVAEELWFRSLLPCVTNRLGAPLRLTICSTAFGLWHIRSARAAGDSVVGTVVVTAAAGAVFHELRLRSGSVLAPAIAHLVINVGGAALLPATAPR